MSSNKRKFIVLFYCLLLIKTDQALLGLFVFSFSWSYFLGWLLFQIKLPKTKLPFEFNPKVNYWLKRFVVAELAAIVVDLVLFGIIFGLKNP